MINIWEVNETNKMIEHENLDVRTITLGISLLDCIDTDLAKVNENIYRKITTVAKDLVKVGKEIENKYCIPIVNKRISITPISLIGASACKTPEDYPTGTCRDRIYLQFRQCRFHKDRDQHGCRQTDGRCHFTGSRIYEGE